jgi:hypothetical protein
MGLTMRLATISASTNQRATHHRAGRITAAEQHRIAGQPGSNVTRHRLLLAASTSQNGKQAGLIFQHGRCYTVM